MATPFCGRARELEEIRGAWRDVANGAGPRLVVLLGESGLGKTRLAQEFYAWLVHQYRDEDGRSYWPATLDEADATLRVNPSLDRIDDQAHPRFLWWGVRLAWPDDRNAIARGAIGRDVQSLTPHLAPFARARRNDRFWGDVATTAGRATVSAALSAIPVVGPAAGAIDYGLQLLQRVQQRRDDRSVRSILDEERDARATLTEKITSDLGILLTPREGQAAIPMVWLVDDAHWSPSDPGVVALFERIQQKAHEYEWPLLTLVTHWEEPWHILRDRDEVESIAHVIETFDPSVAARVTRLTLDTTQPGDLGPVLDAMLPGLTREQRAALLDRGGGVPSFLEEIARYCVSNPKHFEDLDSTNALKPGHLKQVLATTTSLHETVRRRLEDAPDRVRKLVSLSSAQGMRVLHDINRRMVEHLGERAEAFREAIEEITFAEADVPHRFLERTGGSLAEYALPIYLDVARDARPNVIEDERVETALQRALIEAYEQGSDTYAEGEWELLLELTGAVLVTCKDIDHAVIGAEALWEFGRLQYDQGRVEDAVPTLERARAVLQRLVERDALRIEPDLVRTLNDLGIAVGDRGRLGEAIVVHEQARAIRERLVERDAVRFEPDLATTLSNLGAVFVHRGRFDEAIVVHERARTVRERLVGRDAVRFEPDLAATLNNLGNAFAYRGRLDEAIVMLGQARERFGRLVEMDATRFGPVLAGALTHLGVLLQEGGRLGDATGVLEEALAVVRRLAERDAEQFAPWVAELDDRLRAVRTERRW